MRQPVLYVFPISHFCEKARWALDYLAIDYRLEHLPAGLHIAKAKKLGAPRSSLPILIADGQTLQGSANIIEWAESAATGERRLAAASDPERCLEIEQRLDRVAGVHARRYYYSEAIIDCPEKVRPVFLRDLSLFHRLVLRAAWTTLRGRMIRGLDLGAAQGAASRAIIEGELDWLDGLLADGRSYLVGSRFSRADITAASLLAPVAMPREHPVYTELELPPGVAADLVRWRERPALLWVHEIYRQFRWA